MTDTTTVPLRFHPVDQMTVRADFTGGSLSSDFGALLLSQIDRQIGLTARLSGAISDKRHQSYIEHTLEDLLKQRIYQVACGYEDANDSNTLRADPMFKLAVGNRPDDEGGTLAHGSGYTRLGQQMDSKDIYRIAVAFVEQFVASYAKAPKLVVLDMDHTEDEAHGQQELVFFNGHYGSCCYMPLLVFEGLTGKLVTAILRPGKRPKGQENAAIFRRIFKLLRNYWPTTHIVLRGDGHFSNPELMRLAQDDPHADFIFGMTGNGVLQALAKPVLGEARSLFESRAAWAIFSGSPAPSAVKRYDDLDYQAKSWEGLKTRVIVKAEVNALGDNPRFVVTSIDNATPDIVYKEFYCARGQDENYIKDLKNDLASDRTSDHGFLANHLRLFYSCAAYVLIHTLRSEILRGTPMEKARPVTLITKLFKLAVRVVQYKDRIQLKLPGSYPLKSLLYKITEILYRVPTPAIDTG